MMMKTEYRTVARAAENYELFESDCDEVLNGYLRAGWSILHFSTGRNIDEATDVPWWFVVVFERTVIEKSGEGAVAATPLHEVK
jgi:hypothetical protein